MHVQSLDRFQSLEMPYFQALSMRVKLRSPIAWSRLANCPWDERGQVNLPLSIALFVPLWKKLVASVELECVFLFQTTKCCKKNCVCDFESSGWHWTYNGFLAHFSNSKNKSKTETMQQDASFANVKNALLVSTEMLIKEHTTTRTQEELVVRCLSNNTLTWTFAWPHFALYYFIVL